MPARPSTDERIDAADEAGLTVSGTESVSFLGPMEGLVDALSGTLKLGSLMGHYMSSRHRGRFYGIAKSLNRKRKAAFDQSCARYDCLLMPTTPMATHPLPGKDALREEIVARAFSMLANLCGFNATGHPSIFVPEGKTSAGRSSGAMLVGGKYTETTLCQASAVVEQMSFETKMAA